ncbi:sulfurtransferase [Gudongella sp. DL1XJH-153]|uniref:sulfurtransferase n=1 Tax=Gudongella sp. DL1XJH-153 TaxID=3409804 RepID=UPI003BB4891A
MKNFITTKWLKENLDMENLLIFDVRYELGNESYGEEEYNKGHIKGAIFVPMEGLLTGTVREHGGRHPLPDMEEFARRINDLGVDDSKTVVIYDDGELAMAGRLWWMLKYIGKVEVFLLKGGIKEWKDKGYSLSLEKLDPSKGGELTLKIKNSMIADVGDVRQAIEKVDEVIVDSRTPDRYKGEIEPIDRIPGHIPTAVNYPWTELVENLGEIDTEKLAAHYSDLAQYKKIIVHCGSGITGTVNIMFMDEIGLEPVLYLGGYSDWISYDQNKIVDETK